MWAEHHQHELYVRVAQRVEEIGIGTFEAPTSAQWMSWQKQCNDISSRLQQVYLYRLEEETNLIRIELYFLRDKATVEDRAGWQDSLHHDLSAGERLQLRDRTRHLMPTPLLCYALDLSRFPDERRRPG
jgi:hypothetical protein